MKCCTAQTPAEIRALGQVGRGRCLSRAPNTSRSAADPDLSQADESGRDSRKEEFVLGNSCTDFLIGDINCQMKKSTIWTQTSSCLLETNQTSLDMVSTKSKAQRFVAK